MRSKTSYFNGTLFRKNLTRFWPLWGMASFLGCLVPLAALLQLVHGQWNIQPLEATAAYYSVLVYAVPIISLLYAILCAMLVWSYLYNARSVGLMHTLPIRREGLFLTSFLSGMAMLLIPYAITGGLCVLISLAYGRLEPVGLLVTILGVLGESFFYFASATFVAFIVGNIFALPALYFLLHFLAVLLDWLLSTFASSFIFGLSGGYSGAVAWLSPTVYLTETLWVDYTYEEVFVRNDSSMYGGYTDTVLSEVRLENAWGIGVYALAGVVLLALAYALYRRRRSESAGDVVAVGWMRPLFRFGLAALAALLGGRALYALFWDQFQNGDYYSALPMAICMIVAGAIGYYIASMLLAKSPRVFKGSWKGLALVAAGCVAVCCGLRFDVLGIAARVPEISEVESVHLYVADNNYTFYPGEEDDLLEQVRAVHKAIAADADYVKDWQENWRYTRTVNASYTSTYLRLTYTLSNGLTVKRYYNVPLTGERMAQAGTYDYLLDLLVNSEAMKAKRLHLDDPSYTVTGGDIYQYTRDNSTEYLDLSSREAAAVLEAAGKDAAAGAWGQVDWFDARRNDAYALELSLNFDQKLPDGAGTSRDYISITVRPEMANTLACLEELGLIDRERLLTWAQYDNAIYGPSYDSAVSEERVPAGVEYAYEDPAGVGVIGGADGPTQVYVAGAVD